MIYRRDVSVIISPSLSRSGEEREEGRGGEKRRGKSGKPRSSHPVYLHPSGYCDCGLSPRASPSVPGPARSGAVLNGRVVFQLCRRASHSLFLSYCFRKLSRRTGRMDGGKGMSYTRQHPAFPALTILYSVSQHPDGGGLVPLFRGVLSLSPSFRVRPRVSHPR